MRLEYKAETGDLCVMVTARWMPPDGCWPDGTGDRVWLEAEFLDLEGRVIASMGTYAAIGDFEFGYCQPKGVACDPSKHVDKVRIRIADNEGICPPSDWSDPVGLSASSPTYNDLCPPEPDGCCRFYDADGGFVTEFQSTESYCLNPENWAGASSATWAEGPCEEPPPDGYVCQGPFSGIWECAPCNDCVGNAETYATLEECEAACNPPVQECCLVCELPGPPPEKCPDGFFFPNGVDGLCQKYFPTDCSEEQIADAARQCSAAGGAAVGPPDGPCPEPPIENPTYWCCKDGAAYYNWTDAEAEANGETTEQIKQRCEASGGTVLTTGPDQTTDPCQAAIRLDDNPLP
jgi:hypothetical protein